MPEHGQRTDGTNANHRGNNQERMMKTVKIELKWEWKLKGGAWGVTVLMVALPNLTTLSSWLGLA
jgi:hypothetical protein